MATYDLNIYKLAYLAIFIQVLISMNLFSQVAINSDGSSADGSAMLDVKSSNKGFLLPRMTLDEASNISNPVAGLQVYCTDCGVNGEGALLIFMAGAWYKVNLNCLIPSAPSVGQHLFTTDQITWIWEPVINALGYKWNSTNDFTTAIDLANDTATTESGLTCETQYTRYLWTYSQCGISKPRLLTQVTASTYIHAPVQNSSTANKDQIIWRWHAVPGCIGYKWNTVDNFNSASDLGIDTTFVETGLVCNTSYTRYLWAYHECGHSIVTSLVQSTLPCFICGEQVLYEAKSYRTIQIGNQCWLKDNLNIGSRINGSLDQTDNGIIEKYCYNDLESNCDNYGGLYQWGETMNYSASEGSKGICPDGWHIPRDIEWIALRNYLGGIDIAGGKMKEAGYSHWHSPNTGATNSSGFFALPAGVRSITTDFGNLNYYTWFWTSTLQNSDNAKFRLLFYNSETISESAEPFSDGMSVRCLKD